MLITPERFRYYSEEEVPKEIRDIFTELVYEATVHSCYCVEKRLDHCQAYICNIRIACKNYCLLRSYNTYVAFYDYEKNAIHDLLRVEYGYTATSAKHIAKFANKFYKAV